MKKRGISPLIGSVLLIAFVIILFVSITIWVRQSAINPAMESGEGKIASDIETIGTRVKLENYEVEGTKLKLTVTNFGDNTIEGFSVRLIGDNGVDIVEVEEELNQLDSVTKEINFDLSKTGTVEKVEVYPILSSGIAIGAGTSDDTSNVKVNLIDNSGAELGTTEYWNDFGGVTSDDKHSGDYSFYSEGGHNPSSKEYIPIDLDKSYTLEGWFKSYGGGESRLYFGYIPFDENKIQILNEHINAVLNTETTLYEDIDSSDKIVKIVDGTNWYTLWHAKMAFEIDDSGNYNDLPNRKLSIRNIIRVEDKGDYWEIEFETSVGKTYPAGTKVRMHTSGGTYIYSAAGNALIPTEWKKYSSVTSGEALYGYSGSKWWRGTKYVKILILANYAQTSDYKLRADDFFLSSESS